MKRKGRSQFDDDDIFYGIAISEEEKPLVFDPERAKREDKFRPQSYKKDEDDELIPTVVDDGDYEYSESRNNADQSRKRNYSDDENEDSDTVLNSTSSSSDDEKDDQEKDDEDDVVFVKEVIKPKTLQSFSKEKKKKKTENEEKLEQMFVNRSQDEPEQEIMDEEKAKRINEALLRMFPPEKKDEKKEVVKVEAPKKEDPTIAYEKLEAEILKLRSDAYDRFKVITNYQKDVNPRLFDFFVLGAAHLARSLAEKEKVIFVDDKTRERFLNVAAMSIFKNLMREPFTLNQLKAVVATVPETLFLSRLYDAKGMVLSVLRGVPTHPENLNPKRKRFETLPISKLNASFRVSESDNRKDGWKFTFSLPEPKQPLISEVEEMLQKLKQFNDAKKIDKNMLEYIAAYETDPRIFQELVKKAESRDFAFEEQQEKLRRRQKLIYGNKKDEEDEQEDQFGKFLGLDLIGQMGSQKSMSGKKEFNVSDGSLFKDDDDELQEEIDVNEENAWIGSQPDALEMSFIDEEEEELEGNNNREKDGDFLANSIKVIAKISRTDAEKELDFKPSSYDDGKAEEVRKRAKEIWLKYMLNPKSLLPLSEHFYDVEYISDKISIDDYLRGKK